MNQEQTDLVIMYLYWYTNQASQVLENCSNLDTLVFVDITQS